MYADDTVLVDESEAEVVQNGRFLTEMTCRRRMLKLDASESKVLVSERAWYWLSQ